ncbi:hypothetical protein A8F72_17130 [Burkholderia cenocepacia]|nr:hypothetical protein A8F32_26965 [Burkholderia cenocepacia]ONI95406.1 hypothetical protein A8F53_28590 [Burkholderia cenocepacia]ONJ10654.1 hypothetical protein A8F33_09275 [Burkholderia cenocepacia]ONJ26368.1 hypothetical protein A8F38_23500 [Burkholderia cenocepacia]ONY70285.1 hypothetical protein A8F35_22010 [Burkholderia cenocepacia]
MDARSAGRGDARLAHRSAARSFFCDNARTPRRRRTRHACVFATPSCKFDGARGGRRARSAASRRAARFAISGRADWYNRGLAAVAPHHGAAAALSWSSDPAMMQAPVVPEHSSIEENTR